MKIKEGFILKTVANQHIVFPTGNDAINFNGLMRLNETGKELFSFLQTEKTYEELLNFLLDSYDIDETTAKKDLDQFIFDLKQHNIIDL